MELCILGVALGTIEHLLITDEHFTWVSRPPTGVLTLGDPRVDTTSLDYVAKLFRRAIPTFETVPHAKFYKAVGLNSRDVHWQKVLPAPKYRSIINDVIESSRSIAGEFEESGYGFTLAKRLGVLNTLRSARIDRDELAQRISSETDATQISNLKTFAPDREGFARTVKYEGVSTSTGRMNVASGPRILTLRKEHRGLIKSSWGDEGEIVSIDYSSLEPRVALALGGHVPDGDVYEWIDEEIFGGKLGRPRAKILTLSLIYGMSLHSARSKYGDVKHSAKKRLRSMFSVDETTAKLSALDENKIRNHFGRPIFPDNKNKLFNAFVQSTAVDVAVVGFGKVIERLREAGGCQPLFLIHDEIICDVPVSVSNAAEGIFRDGVEINLQNESVSFPVTVEKISDKRSE